MERNCTECNEPIPEGRLKALPKTTTCTKYAYYWLKKGFRVGLICVDTF